jgi:hypothetical protein
LAAENRVEEFASCVKGSWVTNLEVGPGAVGGCGSEQLRASPGACMPGCGLER